MRDYLYTENLAVGYDRQPLIENICLHLRQGEIMTLIGPNGSGKSTILRSIIRQLAPIRGTVYLDGRPMDRMASLEVARRLSLLMTDRVHPELMTCREVTATGRYPYTGKLGLLTAEDWAKVDEALALVHGEELANRDFSQISDGQRQRIMLARAICQEPEVIVLDEPTSFLDIRYKLELLSILKDMVRRRGLAVLMSLHELDLAQKVSDCVACVHNHTIERCGPPEEIFTAEYILHLYDAVRGSYNPAFGCLEMEPPGGEPQVFVIGGGGSGIPVYRSLQRQGIPFAAGVLHENDLDCPVAKALAAAVVTERPFVPIGDKALRRAEEVMASCARVLCPLSVFGPMNEKNRFLSELARQAGKLE